MAEERLVEGQGPKGGTGVGGGGRKKDMIQVSVLCQAGHLGAKGGPHTSVYMYACAQSLLKAPLFHLAFTRCVGRVWGRQSWPGQGPTQL